ncbi:MAG: transglycosylase domain-containing protein, partial [Selenomonadales bacterium]|nr:transglycosylase domain-containing protein [Selenomonadales bacterium]
MTRKLHAQAAILASLAAVTILFLGLNTFLALPPFVQREASLVFARDGTLLTRIFVENREVISIGDVPEHLLQAIIATEDARFYRHFGLDPIGIGRALLEA